MDTATIERFDDILEHHGVKGMHWGIHREKKPAPRPRTGFGPNDKPLHKLDDNELRALVDRLRLENQLMDLSKANSRASAGKAYAQELLKNSGRTIVNTIVSTAAKKAVKQVFKDAKDDKESKGSKD